MRNIRNANTGKEVVGRSWPSFETHACGVLLRTRSELAVKSQTLMVRSAACGAFRRCNCIALRTMKARSASIATRVLGKRKWAAYLLIDV